MRRREGLQSPILKFLPDEAVTGILERTGAEVGDLIFFGADKARVVNDALGALRVKVGEDRGLVADGWAPLWVVDFPMFEKDAPASAGPRCTIRSRRRSQRCRRSAADPGRRCLALTTWC